MNLSHHRSSRRGMPNVEQDLGSLIKKLHSSNNSKGKEKCNGKEKIVEHLDSTKSYEKFIAEHWMLIIAMTSGRVVFLNLLKSKIPSDIAQMIKAAYANISSNAIVFGENGPEIWTFACPKQPYNYECGYYVLTYIRDMLQHSNPIEAIKAKFGGLSQYSEDDHLLPLRQQWLNLKPSSSYPCKPPATHPPATVAREVNQNAIIDAWGGLEEDDGDDDAATLDVLKAVDESPNWPFHDGNRCKSQETQPVMNKSSNGVLGEITNSNDISSPRTKTKMGLVNEVNQKLMESINGSGGIYMTHSVVGGIYLLRFAVGATLTQESHVIEAWNVVKQHAHAILNSIPTTHSQ
ncbi:hypothetical protein G4B88_029979 [Cannabis sativa]|uniref:Ubiquitin-like protease family profile domain-containing protein n=1 Tax=Cannabis sativa TaxID=3483 RepID=A0A7J6GAU0_CANSA|nr:hypothetical protein G4B88_029979 [Cannabis sativa]